MADIDGDGSDNNINGTSGNDSIRGQSGNDTLSGGDGTDTIEGGVGDDSVSGNKGNDSLSGGEGQDTLAGGSGNDQIQGGDGSDSVSGGNNDDTISGNDGNDSIDGGSGNDTVYGGKGDDSITGGGGQDIIVGGRGNDTMAAGNNSTTDTFVIRDGDGSDVITDFDTEEPDVIAFNMAEIQTYQDFIDRVNQVGPDTLITYDNGETTRLLNVDSTTLSPQNFSTEAGPVCLHADTLVQTPFGWRDVQDLSAGDLVVTSDQGDVPVRATCAQHLRFGNEHDPAKPVILKKDCLGPGHPFADCIVSPQHRIAVPGPEGALVFVPAIKLCLRPSIRQMKGRKKAFYHHILLDSMQSSGPTALLSKVYF